MPRRTVRRRKSSYAPKRTYKPRYTSKPRRATAKRSYGAKAQTVRIELVMPGSNPVARPGLSGAVTGAPAPRKAMF